MLVMEDTSSFFFEQTFNRRLFLIDAVVCSV